MKFDDIKVAGYKDQLSSDFKNLNSVLEDIETSFNLITSLSTWDSPTQNYFKEELNNLVNDFDNIKNDFKNINNYLEEVINNHQMSELSNQNIFNDAFSSFK